MQNIISILLTVLYIGIGFLGLLSHRMKLRYYLLLTVHLILVYSLLARFMGQWLTFPLVLVSILIVYLGCQRNLWDVIFSLTGYLLAILVNHFYTIPLSLYGISLETIQAQYYLPFLTANILGTALLHILAKKIFLHSKIAFLGECPRKLQLVFLSQLLLCMGLIALNFIYGEIVGYPAEILAFNGLIISIFTIFTLILFYFLYQLLQENYELKLQQKEQELMRDYTEKLEGHYEDFRVFRHDYKNILSTLNYFIEEEKWGNLKEYYHQKILPTGKALSSSKYAIGNLHLIEIPAVKGLVYTKLITALNKGISPVLELTEPLREVPMDELDLSRILGILLDNAIEAASETPGKLLTIAMVPIEEFLIISIVNSSAPPQVPISRLYEKGYSGKEQHDGLGLYTVRNIVDSLKNVSFRIEYDGHFRQTLEIRRDD